MNRTSSTFNQAGTIALVVPILMLLIIAAVIIILFSQGMIKIPFKQPLSIGTTKQPSVTLQKQYQNPFDKNTQYVNPFSGYKNPFDFLK